MRKTDKNRENQLRELLTDLCDNTLKAFTGFVWITHNVNYANFPKSLTVVCVFDTQENLNAFKESEQLIVVSQLIQHKLRAININISERQISYDTQ